MLIENKNKDQEDNKRDTSSVATLEKPKVKKPPYTELSSLMMTILLWSSSSMFYRSFLVLMVTRPNKSC